MKTLSMLMPLLLLACGKSLSEREVAAKANAALRIEPGLWIEDSKVIWINFPDRRGRAMEEDIKKFSGAARSHCVTRAEAEKPFPEKFTGDDRSPAVPIDCLYSVFQMENGKINATKICFPFRRQTAMYGTYSPTAYDITVFYRSSGSGRMMKIREKGARAGTCEV